MPKEPKEAFFIAVVCILFSNLAVNLNDSQAYKKVEITSESISLVLELSVMFLSFQIGLSFVTSAVVCALLERTLVLDLSSKTTDQSYLKLLTVSRSSPQTLMYVLIPSALLVITFVFSALVPMP